MKVASVGRDPRYATYARCTSFRSEPTSCVLSGGFLTSGEQRVERTSSPAESSASSGKCLHYFAEEWWRRLSGWLALSLREGQRPISHFCARIQKFVGHGVGKAQVPSTFSEGEHSLQKTAKPVIFVQFCFARPVIS